MIHRQTNSLNGAAYEHSNAATCVSVCVFEQYCLELYNPNGQKIKACKTENKGRVVQGKHQSYKLSAAGAEERDSWMDAIRWEHTGGQVFVKVWAGTLDHEDEKSSVAPGSR